MNKKVYVCKECDVEEIIIGKKKGRIFHRGTGKDLTGPEKGS